MLSVAQQKQRTVQILNHDYGKGTVSRKAIRAVVQAVIAGKESGKKPVLPPSAKQRTGASK